MALSIRLITINATKYKMMVASMPVGRSFRPWTAARWTGVEPCRCDIYRSPSESIAGGIRRLDKNKSVIMSGKIDVAGSSQLYVERGAQQ
ncbi:MAG: hypothetical protein K9J79_06585 [Desulfobacteraceae bacterium]|nr:hypothetical protein [Desulfobacteraceae bacterium]